MRVLLTSFLVFLLFGCSQSQPENTLANKNTYKWSGTIGNNIPVFMFYRQYDTVLLGEVVYLDGAQPRAVKIIGEKLDYHYVIQEYDNDGIATAVWDGRVDDKDFTWGGPNAGKQFCGQMLDYKTMKASKFALVKKDTNIAKNITLDSGAVDGTYMFRTVAGYGSGRFSIMKLNSEQALFNAICDSAPRNYRRLVVKDDTIALKNNMAIYRKRSDSSNCEIAFTFYNNFAVVSFYNHPYDCSDANQWIMGIYVKRSSEFTPVDKPVK
jgi:hypothetical protein